MKIQSVLFGRFDVRHDKNKEFIRDLKVFLDVSKDKREACLSKVVEFRLAETGTEEDQLLKDLRERTGLTFIDLRSIIGIATFFTQRLGSIVEDEDFKGDTPEKWAADLRMLELITEDETTQLIEALQYLDSKAVPDYLSSIKERMYASGVFPYLRSVGTTVELRAVQKENYDWSKEVADYEPEITALTPVASIHIRLHRSDPSDFYFQVNEKDLDRLIGTFEAIKKDIRGLREFLENKTQG